MAKVKNSLAKILYGTLFTIEIPIGLWYWARALGPSVSLPTIQNQSLGLALAIAGFTLMLLGMGSLWIVGGGLPMNAFPPPRFVNSGIYSLIPHPIYGGFLAITVGVSIANGSAAGLWFIAPVVALGCVAIIVGYEIPDLISRFGPEAVSATQLPRDSDAKPATLERISLYVLVFVPWFVFYEAVVLMGVPSDAIDARFRFEHQIPVLQWTEVFYASTYLFVLTAPWIAVSGRDLRRFAIRAFVAMAIVFPLFYTVPLIASPRMFVPTTTLGHLLAWERTFDTPAAAFPSFHVIWAILAAQVFASRWPRLKWLFRTWAAAVAVSCVTTGMHALVDVIAGALVGITAFHPLALWKALRNATERFANSWREWHLGPVRIINHGAYVGLAVLVGTFIIGSLLGRSRNVTIIMLTFAGIVGAGLWAQIVEGSSGLLRPYGFYGGVLGIVAVACFAHDTWLVLTAFAVAGPVIQALGRLRCLVQGCCHGSPAPEWIGIRYRHPRSRVCKANLAELPVHPTQLYSILWNFPCALLLLRMWVAHMPLNVIGGAFLILNGAGRFVEEAYRGEPQTKIIRGLRLYQWVAIASAIAGAILTTVPGIENALSPQWNPIAFAFGLGAGLVTWVAMGVDLPASNRRFARLT